MKICGASLIVTVLVLGADMPALCGQSSAPPRTYSFTTVDNMMGPTMTVKVYRDGARELLDESQPPNPNTPAGFHLKVLYDFQAHMQYSWDLLVPSSPCTVSTTTDTSAPFMYDVITGTADLTKELAKFRSKSAGTETLNGTPATIIEFTDASLPAPMRVWRAVQGGWVLKIASVPTNGPPQLQLEIRDFSLVKPAASLLIVPPACAKVTGTPASPPQLPPPPAPPPPPATAMNTTSRQVGSAEANAVPPGFMPPPGFEVVGNNSKMFAFSHVEISYNKAGANQHINPEGRTWQPYFRLVSPNKSSDQTDAAMRTSLKQQGWEILSPPGLLIAHRVDGGKESWFSGAASSGDYRATIVEVGPPPNTLTLPAPAPAVENVADGADYPWLMSFPGSKLVRTVQEPTRTFNAAMPGQPEMLVGQPQVRKVYTLPASVSTYEFVAVYRDALTRAGWTILRTSVGSDAQVVARYARNGRDIFVYLAGDAYTVADVGAQNEARRLAADLVRDGHVAIYGIYFDTDQATIKPESETALQHVLELLKGNGSLMLEVQGHTDNAGTPAHNLPLSDQRAASVKAWLVGHGIAATRLTTRGYGETQPVADNRSPEGRAKNRRVELRKN